jgi:hypothetical protein
MDVTARGILDNMAQLVRQCGFIPNGNRVYYLNRSQPPLFSEMVRTYLARSTSTGSECGDDDEGAAARTPALGSTLPSDGDYAARAVRNAAAACAALSAEDEARLRTVWMPALEAEYWFWMTKRAVRCPSLSLSLSSCY